MTEPVRGPPEDEMQDSITLSAAPRAKPCLEDAFGNPASAFLEDEVPASPTYSVSSMSTLSSISDLDLDSDSESLPLPSKVKSEVADSNDVLENMGNVIHADSLPPENIDPPQKIYQKSRVRGVDVCADADTVEAFRVARAIAATEDSTFNTIGSRQLRSSSKPSSAKKTSPNPCNGDTEISREKSRLSANTGSGANTQLVVSSAAIDQDCEHIQNEDHKPSTTIYSPPNKSHTRKRKVETHDHIQQPDHTLSLETPAPRKKRKQKRSSWWAWVEMEDAETLESKVQKEGLPKEPAKRHTSLPPEYSIQQFSFRAGYLSNSDKDLIRQSRALSEGADKPRDPKPIVPTITRKTGILANATITSGRLRPRKEPSTSSSHRFRKSASDFIVPNNRLIDNGVETSTTSSSRVRPLADITNRLHVEPDAGGETAVKVTTCLDHGSEILTPKRRKLNSSAKSVQNYGGEQVVAPTAVISNVERFGTGVFTVVNGVWMMPKICHKCLKVRQFCDRRTPCDRCSKGGTECTRDEGLVQAKIVKTEQKDEFFPFSSPTPETSSQRKRVRQAWKPPNHVPQLSNETQNPIAPKVKRTRVKREVMNRHQVEYSSQEMSMILHDPQADKPPGIRRPEIWCESRQELCESLTYFRSYQGGCYGHNGLILGSLLDGFPSPRDFVDGKVVITHTGGKSGNDEDGHRRLLASQTKDDKTIKYLLRNIADKSPLVLIMGKNCAISPSKIPHTYCVMAWFKVTVGWAEKDPATGLARWKFRFEKLDTTEDGWWAGEPSVESEHPEEMVMGTCRTCKTESPHIYKEGWMCLDQGCSQFWQLDGKDAPAELEYTHNFIFCRTQWPLECSMPPSELAPTLDENRDIFYNGEDVSRIYWKGPAVPTNTCHEDVAYKRFIVDGMTVMQYMFGDCGTVTHILANKNTNARPKDADWLLQHYQSIEMPFKRFPLQNHKSRGTLLTQQFSFNCGAPYKFIAKVDSSPFDKSPPVVSQALSLITARARLVHANAEFNEILSVGYFEGQKMDYHDDGEAGLGETVASVSLGAPARMRFRLKKKYVKDSHLWTTKPPALQQHDNSNIDDEDEDEENEDLPDLQRKSSARVPKDARVKLDLCLNHGDVMVMSGPGIQKYWEHSVIPLGKFRIAATARFIHPNHAGVREQLVDMNVVTASAENAGSDSISLQSQPSGEIQQVPVSKEYTHEHTGGEDNTAGVENNALDETPLHPRLSESQSIQQALVPYGIDTAVAINQNTSYKQTQEFPRFPTADIFHPADVPIQTPADNSFFTSSTASLFNSMQPPEHTEFYKSRKLPELPENMSI
ncbi:uncharacterized protein H6S33_006344 [Morchella sextelata]|uniref:uncharacterized protein n=1 Tax=Morchella sextelata TaxID=1174677 RepID=UPI001D03CD6F|nr:uncharacterized protein H6S33_006344 [Morchella sextelata]KAH0604676.1 hypothetical protein H6S33_006344 [Morchella sextelata]